MTKQEQVAEMAVIGCVRNPQAHTVEECSKCDFKQGQCNAYRHAEKLYNDGYRKFPDGAVVLTPEERDEEMKATNEILAERDDLIARVGNLGRENYDLKTENEQLKAKIERLKAEFKQLETNAEILARGIRDFNHENYELTEKIKQAKIDVLNEVNEKINVISRKFGDCGRAALFKCSCEIDELIREVQNEN